VHLALVTRPELADTNRLFEAACALRDIAYVPVIPTEVAGAGLDAAPGPRLLYRAATDRAAQLVEKLLFRPGTAALHDPHFLCDHQPILLRQSGVPMPRAVYIPADRPARLAAQVDWLGGFPVVVKRPGEEGGRGVSRAGSQPELERQVAAAGGAVTIEAFVPHARSWRMTVLGGRIVAATARAAAAADFRTNGPGSSELPLSDPPAGAGAIAIAAARALRLDFGGADILESPDGALTLTELNFPCYFADQTRLTGADIAGAMIDFLAARAV